MTDWELTQERQLKDHAEGRSVFSTENSRGAIILGKLLNNLIPFKECLDVGCGILPLPGYMKVASNVMFIGIDPFSGSEREFSFVKGVAENIPFKNQAFDAVLLATSLDHLSNPDEAIKEIYRVLKNKGYLIIWGSFRDESDPKYKLWQKTKSLSIYNHPFAFTLESLNSLLKNKFVLNRIINIVNSEKIIIYNKWQ